LWYSDKVGWEPMLEPSGVLVYEVGDGNFTLYESDFAGTAKNTVMNYVVRDVRAEVARLRERGVTFEEYEFGDFKTVDGIMSDPGGGLTAWFKDVDGNIVAILQDQKVGPDGGISGMLAAADTARAKAWYADKLELEPFQEFEGFVMDYKSGDSRFNVYKTEFAGTAKNTVGVWRLEGLRDEVARLRGRGVEFEDYDFGDEGATVGGILSDAEGDVNAWFKDSEGNILAIAEDRN
jgi:predicted enzyme related to lactoylglutathione lyase/catechol 2,3-dioxygenase-like lactoylglutathione lyase family enzyme